MSSRRRRATRQPRPPGAWTVDAGSARRTRRRFLIVLAIVGLVVLALASSQAFVAVGPSPTP